jgi:hypothetical protein
MIGRHAPKDRSAARRKRRGRQPLVLAGGGALAIALASVWSLASFNGVDIASAAVAKAQSIADVMSGRSPGQRTEGQLTKIKHKRQSRVLAERGQPETPVPPVIAEALAPPAAVVVPEIAPAPALAAAIPPLPLLFKPAPGGAVFFSPGGGGGGPGGGGGGVVTPPGQPRPPAPPPTTETSAVPEPGTWAMMILGFGFTGLALRRRRTAAPQSFLNRDMSPLPHFGRPRTGA